MNDTPPLLPPPPPPPAPRPSNRSCLIGAVFGAGIMLVGGLCLMIVFAAIGSSLSGGATMTGPGPKIAHIDLDGVITSMADFGFGATGLSMVDQVKAELKQALENDDVKAIVLRVNSPGGEVTASDTIYEAIRLANEKKPVVVYMDSVAASGGYYAACGGTEILANETTMTGSIGVIISSLNYRELFGKVGLQFQVFKSGEFKDLLSGSREMNPAEAALIQEMVMETYDKFVGIVSEARDIPVEKLKNGIADGRIFSGAKAKEAGLVDATGYIEDAYDRARELGKAPGAEVLKIHTQPSLLESLALMQSRAATGNRVEIDLSDRLLPRLQPGMVYLLPANWAQ
ncbi:MAG: signal peptide peptidase SppA [Verrucomicrobiales bacterium]|nr:signal peptide peptidase SppA [Verrucomicrobiales bacterium]